MHIVCDLYYLCPHACVRACAHEPACWSAHLILISQQNTMRLLVSVTFLSCVAAQSAWDQQAAFNQDQQAAWGQIQQAGFGQPQQAVFDQVQQNQPTTWMQGGVASRSQGNGGWGHSGGGHGGRTHSIGHSGGGHGGRSHGGRSHGGRHGGHSGGSRGRHGGWNKGTSNNWGPAWNDLKSMNDMGVTDHMVTCTALNGDVGGPGSSFAITFTEEQSNNWWGWSWSKDQTTVSAKFSVQTNDMFVPITVSLVLTELSDIADPTMCMASELGDIIPIREQTSKWGWGKQMWGGPWGQKSDPIFELERIMLTASAMRMFNIDKLPFKKIKHFAGHGLAVSSYIRVKSFKD
ncbi:uncharacterized protein LOC121376436 [Gigantopelta aegis]|uniref:uncharacterized protein LOC121376436 n=1 Tax=Gigantopelta aegis TaxID=1735272 RepID=UPI001B88CD16|nr:uncharacterized protein LOC121376436 [Gigantopelta aegis]